MREDWIEKELGEVLTLTKDKHKPVKIENLLYIGLEHIEKGNGKLSPDVRIDAINTVKNIFQRGQILYGKLRPYLNKVHLATSEGVCSTDILVFQPKQNIYAKYALNFMLSRKFVNDMSANTNGVNLPRVSTKFINEYSIPLPPLPEQRAIVSKIEQLFSELDNGIANLKTAQEQLKVYRQAVLKKAFEGELTKKWREQQTNLPTAEELLGQIKESRNVWINEQIKSGNAEAKRLRAKLSKSSKLHSEKGRLPYEWKWASFIQACHLVVDCHNKTAPYEPNGIYLVRTSNVKDGKLDLNSKIKFVSEETYKFWSRRCFPEAGDILFTREAPMGEAAIIPFDTKICLGQRMMLLRTFRKYLHPKFLLYNILSSMFQQRVLKNAIGTGVKHLRVGDVENLTFPLCSIEEQHQIVQEIESRLSVCDKVEESIKEGLEKAEALRQSILKKAFEGKLLSERELEACRKEPDWEPAEKLLERIREEKKLKPA